MAQIALMIKTCLTKPGICRDAAVKRIWDEIVFIQSLVLWPLVNRQSVSLPQDEAGQSSEARSRRHMMSYIFFDARRPSTVLEIVPRHNETAFGRRFRHLSP